MIQDTIPGKKDTSNWGKEVLLRLPKPLYLEVVKITKENGYKNVQEFIRVAIREKIKKGGI